MFSGSNKNFSDGGFLGMDGNRNHRNFLRLISQNLHVFCSLIMQQLLLMMMMMTMMTMLVLSAYLRTSTTRTMTSRRQRLKT